MAENAKKESASNQFGPYDWKIRETEAKLKKLKMMREEENERAKQMKKTKEEEN